MLGNLKGCTQGTCGAESKYPSWISGCLRKGIAWEKFCKQREICTFSSKPDADIQLSLDKEYLKRYNEYKKLVGIKTKSPSEVSFIGSDSDPTTGAASDGLLKSSMSSHQPPQGGFPKQSFFDSHGQLNTADIKLSRKDILGQMLQIKNVGSKKAELLYNHYGDKLRDVLNSDTAKAIKELKAVSGIGPSTAKAIKEDWDLKEGERGRISQLQSLGLDYETSASLAKISWAELEKKMKAEPYITLIRVNPLVPFHGMDEFVQSCMGVDEAKAMDDRVNATLLCALINAQQHEQHSCLPWGKLCAAAADLLGHDVQDVSLVEWIRSCAVELSNRSNLGDYGLIIDIPSNAEDSKKQMLQEDWLCFLQGQWDDEMVVCNLVIEMIGARKYHRWQGFDQHLVGKLLADISSKQNFSDGQKRALEMVLGNPITIITGWPGSGKTVCLRSIVSLIKAVLSGQHDSKSSVGYGIRAPMDHCLVCTPTGRAASNLSEKGVECVTVHRLLGTQYGLRKDSTKGFGARQQFFHDERNPLQAEFLALDESSMIDGNLFAALFKAIQSSRTRVLIVGDPNQLPSVSAGQVVQDLIDSKLVPVVELRRVFRQAAGNAIIRNIHEILRGHLPDFDQASLADFQNFPSGLKSECVLLSVPPGPNIRIDTQKAVLEVVKKIAEPKRVQVLCTSKTGMAGTVEMNPLLQDILNPRTQSGQNEVVLEMYDHGRISLRTGDKVIHCVNDYRRNVFNGDIGVVTYIYKSTVKVQYLGKSHPVEYSRAAVKNMLQPAWALTVHKAQGGEFPIVVVALSHRTNANRQMLYTAMTRAREYLIMVGHPMEIKNCLATSAKGRYTGIKSKLERFGADYGMKFKERDVFE